MASGKSSQANRVSGMILLKTSYSSISRTSRNVSSNTSIAGKSETISGFTDECLNYSIFGFMNVCQHRLGVRSSRVTTLELICNLLRGFWRGEKSSMPFVPSTLSSENINDLALRDFFLTIGHSSCQQRISHVKVQRFTPGFLDPEKKSSLRHRWLFVPHLGSIRIPHVIHTPLTVLLAICGCTPA